MTARASFTADEVAAMHGVSASLIRKMVARGELARVPNLGNRVRIPYAEVVAKFGPLPDERRFAERIARATLDWWDFDGSYREANHFDGEIDVDAILAEVSS